MGRTLARLQVWDEAIPGRFSGRVVRDAAEWEVQGLLRCFGLAPNVRATIYSLFACVVLTHQNFHPFAQHAGL